MAKKLYVTYHWAEMHGRSNIKAIECKDENEARDVYTDIISLHGILNVRINRCGRIPKWADVISQENYRNGKYYNM